MGIEAKREGNKNEDILERGIMKRRRNKGEANRMVTEWIGQWVEAENTMEEG